MRNSVRKADRVIVQTSALAAAIHTQAQSRRSDSMSFPMDLDWSRTPTAPQSWPEAKLLADRLCEQVRRAEGFRRRIAALREMITRGRAVTLS